MCFLGLFRGMAGRWWAVEMTCTCQDFESVSDHFGTLCIKRSSFLKQSSKNSIKISSFYMGTEIGEAQNKNRKMELNIGCRF